MLRYLAGKGYVTHEQDGPRYVYSPVAEVEEVSRSALRHLVSTFFRNSRRGAGTPPDSLIQIRGRIRN
jgi:predicted transcriptional regulator